MSGIDPTLKDAQETDIVVPIMGATGAGKSSFINSLLRRLGSTKCVVVGEELVSCTSQLESIIIEGQTNNWKRIKGHRIVIVDTPGFDDTYVGDFVILQRIAKWLEESYRKKNARRNLEMFNHLCGDSALDKVILVTSKWGRAYGRNFAKRQEELEKNHWKTMLAGGARVEQLKAGEEDESAWGVIHSILGMVEKRAIEQSKSEALQIQRELVTRRKFLPQTQAARELRTQLQQMLEAQTQMLALEADAVAGNPEAQAQLQEQEAKVKKMAEQIEKLKVSMPKRLARWLKLVMGA
ncbi:hypothetical protein H1R20_g811, partial [Candolleomyces eurysporus]